MVTTEETPAIGADMASVLRRESGVRSYSRCWPTVFTAARGHLLIDESGREYIDFFSAAGSLNYGHNNPRLKPALLDYLDRDPVVQSLDTATPERARFLDLLESLVLTPRGFDHRVQFCGPTGTNAVEAALKLARRVTGRTNVVSFTNAYHGLTLGALATTSGSTYRGAAGLPLSGVSVMPFDGYLGAGVDTVAHLEAMLDDPSSGVDLPAAVILETLQAEGGINVASTTWLRGLADLCIRRQILLIVDDIQVGCGRTGPFFSFDDAGIEPDIVCLSKSISGYGMPMAVNLVKPEHDAHWKPAEHTGTFRGFGPALAMAGAALATFWADDELSTHTASLGHYLEQRLHSIQAAHPEMLSSVRGRGLIHGLECADPSDAIRIRATAFRNGLIVETAGSRDQVIKVLPPLTIDQASLDHGLDLLQEAVAG